MTALTISFATSSSERHCRQLEPREEMSEAAPAVQRSLTCVGMRTHLQLSSAGRSDRDIVLASQRLRRSMNS